MKAKKLLAVLMTSAMLFGTALPTFAAAKPQASDKTTVTVSDVETGARVTAYQIAYAVYNDNGFVKYDSDYVEDVAKPTSEEIANFAASINNGSLNNLTSVVMTDDNNDGVYENELNPGLWVVLVRGTHGAKIYNPMLVSVAYSVSGSDATMTPGNISADKDWELETTNAWAKTSSVTLTKDAKDTADFGEDVAYTIKATVPAYGPEYTDPIFTIEDTLAAGDLKLTDGIITVKVEEQVVPAENYTVMGNTVGSTKFTVTFKSDWVKVNGNAEVVITYDATVTSAKVNTESHDNTVALTYSDNPETIAQVTDTEKVYSFDVGGTATGGIFKKTEATGETALANAEFTLYTDADCTVKYVNEVHLSDNPTATTDDNGNIHITGLDTGTYYLKESKAPNGYTLNDTVYKIDINATVENEELKTWTIKITDMSTNNVTTHTFTVDGDQVDSTGGETTVIKNTELSSLPSTGGIGTTIFTIGGCVIMIVAAGLYFSTRKKEEN